MGISAGRPPSRSQAMTNRSRLRIASAMVVAAMLTTANAAAQSAKPVAAPAKKWVAPRTPDGHPDFQGNWSNATLTPVSRPVGQARALSPAQAAAAEKIRADTIEQLSKQSDPNRPAPPKGGDGSTGAAGNVGGYNYFWIDAGDRMAIVNGEIRSSLVVDPPDGRVPALTPAARARTAERMVKLRDLGGEYAHPETRPLAERCILSFGSNAGPPMLPNYFYNNTYTIVQTRDQVMIMTEMVHDARIIHLGKVPKLPSTMRPWMGDSHGRWVGDTLVVETTNFHPLQRFYTASDNLKLTERFHRADEGTILYRFTVEDPTTFTAPWSGELPFVKLKELIYEYACHEANYALSNILSGERQRDREAATKPNVP